MTCYSCMLDGKTFFILSLHLQGGKVFPILGRLCPKGVHFSGFRSVKSAFDIKSTFYTWSAVCSLYFVTSLPAEVVQSAFLCLVCSLHFVLSLEQFAVCILYLVCSRCMSFADGRLHLGQNSILVSLNFTQIRENNTHFVPSLHLLPGL